MDFFKDIWLKIITYLCCIQNQEVPNTEKPITPTSQEPIIEKRESLHEHSDFIKIMKSKIAKSKLTPQEKETIVTTHEKLNNISILLKKYFQGNTDTIKDENESLHEASKRMFQGYLSSKPQSELFVAIEQANFMGIQKAISNGADVNKAINYIDPLKYAIRHGKDSVIQFLLDKGAEINDEHIQLAHSYQIIYETNLKEKDMVFYNTKKEEIIAEDVIREEMRQYFFIEKLLQQELLVQKQKKEREQNAKPQEETITSSATSATAAATSTLSARPRVVLFTPQTSSKKTASSNDKI